MHNFFKKYFLIIILIITIPIVLFSEDNLINMLFKKVYLKISNKPIIRSNNKIPDMSFQILNIDEEISDKNENVFNKFSTKNMIGQKYIIHFFASWCGYCIEEYPLFFELKKEKIPVYAIAWKDSDENIKYIIKKLGNPFEKILLDPFGFDSSSLQISAIPLTILIDSKGNAVFGKMGQIDQNELISKFREAR
jgi:thiol-disulfide isomerase/thioredoxin